MWGLFFVYCIMTIIDGWTVNPKAWQDMPEYKKDAMLCRTKRMIEEKHGKKIISFERLADNVTPEPKSIHDAPVGWLIIQWQFTL